MNYEDLHACRWARHFEQHIGSSLDACGLLRARDFQNAWIHPLKDQVVKVEIDHHLYNYCIYIYKLYNILLLCIYIYELYIYI